MLSHVQLFEAPWTLAHQAPLSRQESWSQFPCPPPGDLLNPGIELGSPALQVDSLPAEPPGKPKDTGVGSLSLIQGIFPTQESNWTLLHCRQILGHLSHQGSPRILECIAYPFSRGPSQLSNRTGVSCIAGRFISSWATRKPILQRVIFKKKEV